MFTISGEKEMNMELKVSKISDLAENALPVVDYRKISIIAKLPLTSRKMS